MMKTKYFLIPTAFVAFAAGIGTMILTSSREFNPERDSVKSEVPYCVTSPQVPQSIDFAGQKIDLLRYDHRERMDRELLSFTYMHSSTMQSIKRANRYFPVIEPILREEGVPDDFKYLAVIESSLNPRARSGAGAAGLWQFMPVTGREYNLEVNKAVDERYHIEKETRAACRYLKEAYARFGNWICVAASYNAGQGRISSQMSKQLESQAIDLWLNDETSRYMFRLLAAKAVIGEPQRYGFLLRKSQLYPPLQYRTVEVDTTITSLAEFAREQGVSYAQLKDANSWLRDTTLPNRSRRRYQLLIPTQESMHYNPDTIRAHSKHWVID